MRGEANSRQQQFILVCDNDLGLFSKTFEGKGATQGVVRSTLAVGR